MGWSLPALLDRMLMDAIPVVVPVILLTLCGVLIGWRIHVYEYNRSAGGASTGSSRFLHKIHLWQPFSYSPQPRYCNGCHQLISGFLLFRNMGYECQCCGLQSHLSCLLVCERSSCKAPGRLSHQFREGNLENTAVCALCGVVCSSSFSLFGLECLWCRKAFHASCLERSKESRQPIAIYCDLGPLAHLVVPPSALCARVRPAAARKQSVENLTAPPQSPVITSAPAPSRGNEAEEGAAASSARAAQAMSTANVDVDTKPVRRVALSARKANDWQLVNFPDTTDLRPLYEFWEQSRAQEEAPAAVAAAEAGGEETGGGETVGGGETTSPARAEGAPAQAAAPPQHHHQPMKLLRSLVKSNCGSDAAAAVPVGRQWAEFVCQLFPAVSDMMMALERTGVFPFVVFVNPKSGGQLGSLILKESYAYLNPWQVVDMSIEKNPLEALTRFQGLAMTGRLRALACGGDGSVSWVVDSVHCKYQKVPSYATLTKLYQCAKAFLAGGTGLRELQLALKEVNWEPVQVPVAVLPLGTGNDLSKVLNWGANFSNHLEYLPFMRKLIFAKPVPIDLWTVEVFKTAKPGAAEEPPPTLRKTFTNYVDLGIAARIALKFHTLREAHPELFRSRLGNKFLYGEVGVRDYLVDQAINFKDIAIYCDQERVDLDRVINNGGLEGLAVVNIPSFGGGVEPWKGVSARARAKKGTARADDSPAASTELVSAAGLPHSSSLLFFTDDEHQELSKEKYRHFRPQRIADGRLELIGFRSLLHLGRVQVGIADSVKIAQGKSFTIHVKHKVPFQVDGEPSTIAMAEIRIRWKCRTTVLALREASAAYGRRGPVDDLERLHELSSVHLSLDDIKKALEKANDAGEIDNEQLRSLLRRFRYLSHPQLASF